MRYYVRVATVAVLAVLLLAVLWASADLNAKHVALNIAGVTRPLWESPLPSFNVTPHYYVPQLTAREQCLLHGWSVETETPKMVDAILFSIELDILEVARK